MVLLSLLFCFTLLNAQEVKITKNIRSVTVHAKGKKYIIERTQKEGDYLNNSFALTSRPSPPFFIEPFLASKKVQTYGELEVLSFIKKQKGVFIDARLKNWYQKSSIPTAINIPFKVFLQESPQLNGILKSFGARYSSEEQEWDFSQAKRLLFYCNGAWCGQSPLAIHALIDMGYPKEKLKYYRGGMQAWQLLGLTTINPKERR